MAPSVGHALDERCRSGGGLCGHGYAARPRRFAGPHRHAWLVLALSLLATGCGAPTPARCTIGDLDDQMVSTRAVFLERLAGCPIGGRD